MPARIEAQHFGNANIVSVAGGNMHSAAVTKEGTLYTWGNVLGLGHANGEAKWMPTRITPSLLQGARVGRCHDLPPMHALAFAMGTHSLLGSRAAPTAVVAGGSNQRRSQRQQGKTPAAADKYVTMPGELVQRVVEACVSWPEGQVGELEGVARFLGGGIMKTRGST